MMEDWSNWRPNIMNIVYGVHTALGTRSGAGWQFMGYVALVWTIDSLVAIWLTFPRGVGPFWLRWRQGWASTGGPTLHALTLIFIVLAGCGSGRCCLSSDGRA